jgi:uroporphyrinogen-III synthase
VRPDLRPHPLHGNVDTRLRRLDEGATDALVLAVAGLSRLGRAARIGEILSPEVCPPAPGQGALAIQCRADDQIARAVIGRLDDPATRAAVEAERELLRATGGGCRAPIGVLATVEGAEIALCGAAGGTAAGTAAGTTDATAEKAPPPVVIRGEARGPVASRLSLARDLASRLTGELTGEWPGEPAVGTASVLVTRTAAQAEPLVTALAAESLTAVVVPTIEIRPVGPGADLDTALERAARASWIAITSSNAVGPVLDAAARLGSDLSAVRWAAVGTITRQALEARGISVSFVPSTADSATLADELPLEPGETVFLPRADIADWKLVAGLESRGASVESVVAYRTVEGPESARESLRALFAAGGPDAIVFASASAVRGLAVLLGRAHLEVARRTVACCIGESTATAARHIGFGLVFVAPAAEPASLARLVGTALSAQLAGPPPNPGPEDPA